MRFLGLLATVATALTMAPFAATAQRDEGTEPVAEQCLQDLQRLNAELITGGYGLTGPRGYGTGEWRATGAGAGAGIGAGTGVAAGGGVPPGIFGTGVATSGDTYPGALTPRGEMRVLMQAGYILALKGDQQACEAVLSAVRDSQSRYEAAMRGEGDWDVERQEWRERYLASAAPVTELEGPIRIDQILGADVRSMRDQDLGDIEDVVTGPQGDIKYALLGRGGFLGINENLVPVRWADLRLTLSPYRDTFVLDVPAEAFERAPAIDEGNQHLLATADWQRQVDRFWNESLAEDTP